MKVHVYSSTFENEDQAFRFSTEMDYDDDDSSPELWQRIGAKYLDGDFIETIYGVDRFEYLATVLREPSEVTQLSAASPDHHNTLFLIFGIESTSNEDFKPVKCENPMYLGSPETKLD